MSDIDDLKSQIAGISAKVSQLVSVIPDEKLALLRNPDANLKQIDELKARVAEVGDLSTQLSSLERVIDSAIAEVNDMKNKQPNATQEQGTKDGQSGAAPDPMVSLASPDMQEQYNRSRAEGQATTSAAAAAPSKAEADKASTNPGKKSGEDESLSGRSSKK